MENKKAVILLSGGLDSATTAAIALGRGFKMSAMTFLYGQKHEIELEAAKKLVSFFHIQDHVIIELPDILFDSALVKGSDKDIPRNRNDEQENSIPETYVPARNILFLSYALAYAETTGARDIFIGANAVDYSGYPDCRPDFIKSFSNMANTGTKAGVNGDCFRIEAPLLKMKKSEIITRGTELGVDYSMTHSCYDPTDDGSSCGECNSCYIRKKGFAEAGVEDPIKYGTR